MASPAPDVEKIVAEFLRAQSAVSALVGTRVWTDRQGVPAPTYPYVLVALLGGPLPTDPAHWLTTARLQVEAWWRNGTKPQTRSVIAAVAAVLPQLENTVHADGVVGTVDVAAPRWLPDGASTPATPRYLLDLSLTAHPLAA